MPAAGDAPLLCDLVREVDLDSMMQVLMVWLMLLMEVIPGCTAEARCLRYAPGRETSVLLQVGPTAAATMVVMVAVRMR